jgi:hypothetical protein
MRMMKRFLMPIGDHHNIKKYITGNYIPIEGDYVFLCEAESTTKDENEYQNEIYERI